MCAKVQDKQEKTPVKNNFPTIPCSQCFNIGKISKDPLVTYTNIT